MKKHRFLASFRARVGGIPASITHESTARIQGPFCDEGAAGGGVVLLIHAGDLPLKDGADVHVLPGVLIKIEREVLAAVPHLPMYEQVVVVPAKDLDAIHTALKRSLRVMEGEEDFRAIECVRTALAELEGHQ